MVSELLMYSFIAWPRGHLPYALSEQLGSTDEALNCLCLVHILLHEVPPDRSHQLILQAPNVDHSAS